MINELTINFAIYEANLPSWNWHSVENGWVGYLIWYVEKGGADIVVGQEKYSVFPGDLFLFDFKESYICTHDPKNPIETSTIHFNCRELTPKTRVIRQSPLLAETAHQIRRCLDAEYMSNAELWMQSLLSSFCNPLPELTHCHTVISCCHYMENHLRDPITLDTLSSYSGYSKNQLLRLFHHDLQCTPMEYLLQQRIKVAKRHLLYSNKSIKTISDLVGFYDDSHFSKAFKRQVGCSPGDFRKKSIFLNTDSVPDKANGA